MNFIELQRLLCLLGSVNIASMERCFIVVNNGIGALDYDPRTGVCCGDIVHKRYNNKGEERGCCGGVNLYRKSDQICCGSGNVTDRFIQTGENTGLEQKCCGNKTYPVNTIERNTHCCGDQYISTKKGCCNDTTPFNKTTSACEKKQVVPRFHAYCDEILYDKRKQICCGGSNLYNKSSSDGHFRCCGEFLFDNRREQCCKWAGITKVQSSNGYCCGTGLYNSLNEICCHNKVYGSPNRTIQCCGNGSYDKRHQTCCHDIVHNIKHVNDPKCCGKDVYSTTSHLCCSGDQIIKKNASDHDQCCLRNSEFYSCKNQLGRPSIFCGYQRYDNQTDLCCNNQVHKGAKETGRECCHPGQRNYDPRNEKCCHGVVKSNAESCSEQSDAPSSSTQSSNDISGICSVNSQEWTTWKIRKSLNDSKLDICRKNGYIMKIQDITCYNSTKYLFPRMVLKAIAMKNFYNDADALYKKKTVKVHLPCSCKNRDKWRREKVLLVTDIDIKLPLKIFHLGDSEIILPFRKRVLNDVKMKSKRCSHQVIRNIYSILKQTSLK